MNSQEAFVATSQGIFGSIARFMVPHGEDRKKCEIFYQKGSAMSRSMPGFEMTYLILKSTFSSKTAEADSQDDQSKQLARLLHTKGHQPHQAPLWEVPS